MQTNYRLGRIAGVEVGLNWSVLALLALLMWTLATGVFPETNPGLGDNTHFVMAVIAALGFFASILLHELGHAVQARRDGMEIDGITLWLFGGVARFKGMFPTAGAEFRIAIAGPLVTLVLAGLFVGGALIGLPEAADGVCAWLGFINLLLLGFNLIPSLPLDGGRMLRAAIWHFKGDLQGATRFAAGSGRVFSILMIAAGVGITIMGGLISGIWLVFIGWFLLQAAGAEARIVQSPSVVAATLTVRDLMTEHPVTLADAQTLSEIADEVRRSGQEAYPVLHEGVPVGLFPAMALTAIPESMWDGTRVGDHMAALDEVPSLEPEDGIVVAVAALQTSRLQRALVIEEGDLVGVLSLGDVARALGARPA